MVLDVTPLIELDAKMEHAVETLAATQLERTGLIDALAAVPGDELIEQFAEPGSRVNLLSLRNELIAGGQRETELTQLLQDLVVQLRKRTGWVVELADNVRRQQREIELLKHRIAKQEGVSRE